MHGNKYRQLFMGRYPQALFTAEQACRRRFFLSKNSMCFSFKSVRVGQKLTTFVNLVNIPGIFGNTCVHTVRTVKTVRSEHTLHTVRTVRSVHNVTVHTVPYRTISHRTVR